MKRHLLLLALLPIFGCREEERLHNTFSIVCRDPGTGDFGVAVTTMPTEVRRWCPFARAEVGAVCTQAMTNRQYGPDGLDLLAKGLAPEGVIRQLTDADSQRAQRQVGAIGGKGAPASYTGKSCMKWCGHLLGKDYAIQGNLLVSEKTIQEAARAFEETKGSLGGRMIAALRAGKAAGGDKRGHRSCGLIVASKRSGDKELLIDLKKDDDPEPVEKAAERFFKECAEWFEIGDRRFGEGDEGGDVKQLEGILKGDGLFDGEPDAKFDESTKKALHAWQKKRKIRETGRVDEATIKELTRKRKDY